MKKMSQIGRRKISQHTPLLFSKPKSKFFILTFTFFLFTFTYTFSQENKEWKLYSEKDGISIYTQTIECHDNANGLHYEYVVIKITNTNKTDKSVNLSPQLYYDNKKYASTSDKPEKNTFTIKAKSEVQGDCSSNCPENLRIFSRFLNYTDKPELTRFEIEVKVENIK